MSRYLSVILLLAVTALWAQPPAKQPQKIIDMHTAGALLKGSYSLDFRFFNQGGTATSISVGLTNRLSIGIGYELMRVIGNAHISGQSFPGGFAKYRLMEESYYLPGLSLGFESQGSGDFYKSGDLFPRFYFKSKGFFSALSKSYLFLGQPLGFHAEVNYSTVDNQAKSEGPLPGRKSNRFINGSVGIDKSLNEEIALLCEYDLALDDNHSRNPLEGYLNAGVRWSIIPSLAIEVDFKDILENKIFDDARQDMLREVRILFVDKF